MAEGTRFGGLVDSVQGHNSWGGYKCAGRI